MTPTLFFPALFAVLWATGFIGARLGLPYAEPMAFLSVRFAIAFVLLAALAFIARAPWPSKREFLHSALVGALLHGLYLGGVFWSIDRGMPSGLAAMIVGLQPVLTAFLASQLLGEPIGPRHWIGLVVGTIGLGFVLLPPLDIAGSGVTLFTIALCTASAIGATLGTVFQKRFVSTADLRTGMCAQYLGAFLPCAVLAVLFEEFAFDWTVELIVAFFWAIFVLSIGAIFLLMHLIKQGSVARLSSLFFLVPGITAVIAWAWFGEQLSWIQIGGMVCCGAAVALVTLAPKRA